MERELRALSVQQPWASAIVAGGKRVENRTWRTAFRGTLLIHAGLKCDPEGAALLAAAGIELADELPRGAVVGVVELSDCVPASDPSVRLDRLAFGPFCLVLARARALAQPILWKGALGLWKPPAELVARVEDQLGHALGSAVSVKE